jgi:uncharacterized OsmC-like protein/pimeloyl-ACP methyl ester carboxylesterase
MTGHPITSQKTEFTGSLGETLAGRLDTPVGKVRGFALFAHCFSCSKDVMAASRVSSVLAGHGIATLRFDFTGLGNSDGDFASTNFSSNVADLLAAMDFMAAEGKAPALIIGHSLGGAAVLMAASQRDFVKAVATINAPSDAAHITDQFADHLAAIEVEGEAMVSLAGRPFRMRRQFLDDVRSVRILDAAERLRKPLLILHAPKDQIVSIDHATRLFVAAKHPKSFVSLDEASHLLSRSEDAEFAGDMIAAFARRYLPPDEAHKAASSQGPHGVFARESAGQKFTVAMTARQHGMTADEPKDLGGADQGPTPYELLNAALASCTAITVRMVADRKNIPLQSVSLGVTHEQVDGDEPGTRLDVFCRALTFEGDLTDEQRHYLLGIANKCPVHRTLHRPSRVDTILKE